MLLNFVLLEQNQSINTLTQCLDYVWAYGVGHIKVSSAFRPDRFEKSQILSSNLTPL